MKNYASAMGLAQLEVRCCCDAHLLGYLAHPRLQRPGDRYTFWESFDIPEPVESTFGSHVLVPRQRPVLKFELTVDTYWTSISRIDPEGSPSLNREQRVGIKSRDYPMEWLRSIPGFVEAR